MKKRYWIVELVIAYGDTMHKAVRVEHECGTIEEATAYCQSWGREYYYIQEVWVVD